MATKSIASEGSGLSIIKQIGLTIVFILVLMSLLGLIGFLVLKLVL